MKQINSVLFAIIILASAAVAQDKLLTIDDIFSLDPKVRVNFSGTPTRLTWARDGKSFRQVQAGKLLRVDAVTGDAKDFFDARKLQTQLERQGIATAEAARLANAPGLQFDPAESAIILENANDLWHYNTVTGTVRRLTNNPAEEKEPDFSPDGKWVSFVRGNNLFVVDVATGRERQITRDGAEKILNGYLDWIYQEEIYGRGNFRAYWWSPDSRYITFLRLDESPVPKFVLTNDIPDNQVVENTDYPQAGDPNPLVRLAIADITRPVVTPRFVNLPKYTPEDLLIARVAWTPDSKTVMFQALNREQTFLDLNAARLDGTVTNVLKETTPAWVEVYDNPEFLKNGTAIWQSARSGWRHLYLYDNNGKLVRQLTNGDWEIRNFYGVDPANEWAYFSATKDSHIRENVYRVRIADGTIERLTRSTSGSHSASFDPTFSFFIDTWTDINTPIQQRLYRSDGTLVKVVNENPVPALRQYRLGPVEFMKVKTRDGFEMEAMMIKPPDFDPSRKYPVLQYTYAGPHAPSVADRWMGSRGMWHQMLAQKGYIIWICDNRTASGKGEQSVWPGYKNFMVLELQDIEDGVSYLKSLPYVDGNRIGIWGWSFGGMMTSYALTHSKSFKAGIAGGTVGDWRLYDSIYTERYMLQPKNNPAGFDRTSVIKAASNLNGRLLLIHGWMDDNVHVQNTTQLVYELQKAGKQFDLMLYPTQRHGISNPAQVKHWYTMMTDWVLRNL